VKRTGLVASIAGGAVVLGTLGVLAASPSVSTTSAPAASSLTKVLDSVPIKGRAPKTGYTRDQFGPTWYDEDRNGCDTRNDILKRDMEDVTLQPGSKCIVIGGLLHDPYNAKSDIMFTRGSQTSGIVQIDHLVPLSDAWQKGAQQLTPEKRRALANDPLNLLATYGPTNEAKGDSDAATWLPPDTSFRCAYVSRQIQVKKKYGLWMTQAEHDAIANILQNCP
jgi:hypothetical protein